MRGSDQIAVHDVLTWLGPRSTKQIGEITALSRSRLSSAIEALLDEGWIAPSSDRSATGGRRAVLFELNHDRGAVVGLDIEPGRAAILVAGASLRTAASSECELRNDESPGTSMARIVGTIAAALSESRISPTDVLAVGVSLPGSVTTDSGILTNPPSMPMWQGFGVGDQLRDQFPGATVAILNDANAMAFNELRSLRLKASTIGDETVVCVKMGPYGIGGGIIVGGQLVRGTHGGAGEIGHILVEPDGPLCGCGRRGCLEAVAGPSGIIRRAVQGARANDSRTLADRLTQHGSLELGDITEAARSGDEFANQVIGEAGQQIGRVVASLVNILDPERIVVGGRLSLIGPSILAAIRQQVYSLAPPLSTGRLTVEFSSLEADSSLKGVALHALLRSREERR